MDQSNIPSPTPKDATESTEDQRRLQENWITGRMIQTLRAGTQSRHQIADET